MTGKMVDNYWGSRGTDLLPQSLRKAWAGEALPEWVAKELGLAVDSTAEALDATIWATTGVSLSDRIRNFLLNLLNARRTEVRSVKVFMQTWPYWLEVKDLPFSTRTRNCLVFAGLLTDPEQLSDLTYGKLFDIPSMGAVSILEFACVAEATLEKAIAPPEEPSALAEEELIEIVAEPWAAQVGPADPRFSELIPSLSGATILEALDNLTSRPDADRLELRQLVSALHEIRERVSQIKSLSLERQLSDFLLAVSRLEGERLLALLARLGWNGSPAITLEEAGAQLGVTRERMRQVQSRVANRLTEIPFPVYLPALDAALQVLWEKSPIGVSEASMLLKAIGLSEIEFHPSCVIAAAKACGRKASVRIQTLGKRSSVVATDFPNADAVLQIAYRQTHASGASNLTEVAAELSSKGVATEESDVRHALREFSDVQFLEGEWFFHLPKYPERDRLRNVTRKMLSVTAPIELSALREGIRREYRYRGHRGVKTWPLIVPPRSILRGYYQAHPEFSVTDDDFVNSVVPLDYRTELALNDSILVDALRSSPACVLDRMSLWSECARRSMNINTFNIYTSYSPVLLHLGTDIWSLRGVRVDPAAVEAVRVANAMRPREKRVLDHGWTIQGRLWVATRLPSGSSGHPVFGIPGAIKRFLVGRQFTAKDDADISHGTVRINEEGSSYGFGTFLRQRGGDEGDILITEFDLERGTALVRLGNDDLLEEMSPET